MDAASLGFMNVDYFMYIPFERSVMNKRKQTWKMIIVQ